MLESKPIKKADDEAKLLIIETLENQQTGGFDIDCVYKIKEKYFLIEFLKCDTVRPNDSHPRRYWFKNRQKFLSLWELASRLDARLYLVNYEESRQQFKVIRVHEMDESGILREEIKMWNQVEFKRWFQRLNRLALAP